MDFNDNPKEAEFRTKVRKFLDANAQRRGEIVKTPTTAGAPESVNGEKAAHDALMKAKEWQKKKAKSATKIQAQIRGRSARKKVLKKGRTGKENNNREGSPVKN